MDRATVRPAVGAAVERAVEAEQLIRPGRQSGGALSFGGVAHQVDNHQVLGTVLCALCERLTERRVVLGTKTARTSALDRTGLDVPGDVSVAGYDNITLAGIRAVSLLTVDQDGHRIGTTAIRLLLDRISDPGRQATQVKLTPTPVVRGTTGPPR